MDLASPLAFAPCIRVTGCKDGLTYQVNKWGDWAVYKRGDPAKLAGGSTGTLASGWAQARIAVDQLLKTAAQAEHKAALIDAWYAKAVVHDSPKEPA